MTDTSEQHSEDAVLAEYEKFFATQDVEGDDLYKWGALWVFWQAAYAAGLSARNEWISVKEELPKERLRVLAWDGLTTEDCFFGKGTASGAEDWENSHWRITGSEKICRFPIICWQFLPSPPEEK